MAMLRLSRIAFLSLRVWKVERHDMKEEEEEEEDKEKERCRQGRRRTRGKKKGKDAETFGGQEGGMSEKGVESKDG